MVTFEEIPNDSAQEKPSVKPSKHVRPRNRSKIPTSSSSDVVAVELKQSLSSSANNSTTGSQATTTSKPPPHKSILKTPKYTRQLMNDAAATAKEMEEATADSILSSTPKAPPPCKHEIVERKIHRRNKTRKGPKNVDTGPSTSTNNSSAIEGYTPVAAGKPALPKMATATEQDSIKSDTTTETRSRAKDTKSNNNNNNDKNNTSNCNDQDMVFNSLADLMQAAGTLPEDQSIDKEGTMVETDLSFNAMSPEEYAAQLERDEEGEVDILDSTSDNPALDAVNHDDDYYDHYHHDDDHSTDKENSDDEGMWDLLHDMDDLDEPTETREPRAFLQIWKALSQWVTPRAVAYVVEQRGSEYEGALPVKPPETKWSDVESTRCAGLMSLLQLYLGPCLQDDLHLSLEERRGVELRLGYLVRCFDFSQASPKLNAQHARALTCVLVQTVLLQDGDTLPTSCAKAQLSHDEYQYLIRSGIANFQSEATQTEARTPDIAPHQ